ncbi:hypothetical protein SmJEL517_g06239 [Synchytrium microbalum]|uniref:Fork-head domain-containing protein n=1 Tax=Synchytrium microbalum TaxID=1806994 RepID=A0A507BRG1_9FUNG|nr:uncharacterized protein SmJEL517_g06239 [Synchytrium microbalum]TPX30128.1 hypothetical protein SmJEL517_g06239 [Synchytrium microbalum]
MDMSNLELLDGPWHFSREISNGNSSWYCQTSQLPRPTPPYVAGIKVERYLKNDTCSSIQVPPFERSETLQGDSMESRSTNMAVMLPMDTSTALAWTPSPQFFTSSPLVESWASSLFSDPPQPVSTVFATNETSTTQLDDIGGLKMHFSEQEDFVTPRDKLSAPIPDELVHAPTSHSIPMPLRRRVDTHSDSATTFKHSRWTPYPTSSSAVIAPWAYEFPGGDLNRNLRSWDLRSDNNSHSTIHVPSSSQCQDDSLTIKAIRGDYHPTEALLHPPTTSRAEPPPKSTTQDPDEAQYPVSTQSTSRGMSDECPTRNASTYANNDIVDSLSFMVAGSFNSFEGFAELLNPKSQSLPPPSVFSSLTGSSESRLVTPKPASTTKSNNLDLDGIEKPKSTYESLLKQALESKPDKTMALAEIYEWIELKYPYFGFPKNGGYKHASLGRNNSSMNLMDTESLSISASLLQVPVYRRRSILAATRKHVTDGPVNESNAPMNSDSQDPDYEPSVSNVTLPRLIIQRPAAVRSIGSYPTPNSSAIDLNPTYAYNEPRNVETYHGYIRTTQDALLLIEACRVGKLKRVPRRLTESERSTNIKSGAVFIWNEEESGIKRWTDGIKWTASRISGSFLVYRELSVKYNGPKGTRQPPAIKEGGLIKRAISVTASDGRKHHLVSYYTAGELKSNSLVYPSDDPTLSSVVVATDLYPEFTAHTPPVETLTPRTELSPVDPRGQDPSTNRTMMNLSGRRTSEAISTQDHRGVGPIRRQMHPVRSAPYNYAPPSPVYSSAAAAYSAPSAYSSSETHMYYLAHRESCPPPQLPPLMHQQYQPMYYSSQPPQFGMHLYDRPTTRHQGPSN